MRTYLAYTNEDIHRCAAEVTSLAGLLKKLGLRPAGGNFANMKAKLQQLAVNCEHWTGPAWNKGARLKDWSKYRKISSLRPHLLKLKSEQCENCGLTTWLDSPISLEVHHINGDRTDNRLENLQALCPNCHSFTDNYRNKKLSAQAEKPEVERVKFNETYCHGNVEPSSKREGAETKRRGPKSKDKVKT